MRGCLRAHWFSKYARGEPEEAHAKRLDLLATAEMLGGVVVDLQVNAALGLIRSGKLAGDLPGKGVTVWRRMLKASEVHAEAMRGGQSLPMNAQPLLSHYYRRKLERELAEQVEENVVRSLEGFLQSGLLARLMQIPEERWMPQRPEWEPAARLWELNGIKIWSNLDFWIDYGERGFIVIDWKTGTYVGHEEALQLASYSVYAQVSRGLQREQVLVQAAHLPLAPDWAVKAVSQEECDALIETINEDASFEGSMLEETVLENGERVFWADRERFPAEPSTRRCSRCKFLEICPEGMAFVDFNRVDIEPTEQTEHDSS